MSEPLLQSDLYRDMVHELCDDAVKFHSHPSLRELIANTVHRYITPAGKDECESPQRQLAQANAENAELRKQLNDASLDAERLYLIEAMAKQSRTGLTVQFINFAGEGGEPSLKGYRIMTYHNLREPYLSVREAIDSAIKES